MNIGLIGTGAIGTFLLDQLNNEKSVPHYQVSAVFDEREKATESLQQLAKTYHFQPYNNLETFLAAPIDIVVECANIAVVHKYARDIIKQKSLLIISVGAFADEKFHQDLDMLAKETNHKVYLPSGAIGGLDILQAARTLDGLETVQLTTRKPAIALSDEMIKKETTLFKGTAQEAIKKYPKNANIAIVIALAGIGLEKTTVQMIADPAVQTNEHHVEAKGTFGNMSLTVNNYPSPHNPKTSYLTALSVLATLQALEQTISIG